MKKAIFLLGVFPVFLSGNAQNVGIGTATPLMQLHIAKTDNQVLLLENTQPLNSNVSNALNFKTGSGSYPYTGAIKTIGQNASEARLGFFTYAWFDPNGLLERLSITDDGNVGIGTITPNAKLDVNGTLKVADGTQSAGRILTSDATGLASWQPLPPPPGTNDPSVSICCQRWMTKNLDVNTYRNGDVIPQVTDAGTWASLTTGAYCYYNNDSATYAATYGKLYNWYAVNDPRGLAPQGWYIPTDFEWTTLGNCLGGYAVAGGPMKEKGTIHWNTPNTGGTNLSGFNGLPGGYRYIDGTFYSLSTVGLWWSSTEEETDTAWRPQLSNNASTLNRNASDKNNGLSVRCLRD